MEGAGIDKEKLAKLQRMAAGVRVGGKGSVRRKKKAVHKAALTDDKRLQATLKRLQLNQLPGIEEVNIFRDNGSVMNFQNPKVQAQISANTYVVSGQGVTKSLQDMLPSIVNQLGADNMPQMKSLMDQLGAAGLGGQGAAPTASAENADDEEIPDLVGSANFEEKATADVSAKGSVDEVKNDTDEVKKDTDEAKKDTGDVKKDTDEVKKDTDEAKKDTGEAKKDTGEVKKDTGEVKKHTDEAKKDTGKAKKDAGKVKKDTGKAKKDTGKVKKDAGEVKKHTAEETKDDTAGKGDLKAPIESQADKSA